MITRFWSIPNPDYCFISVLQNLTSNQRPVLQSPDLSQPIRGQYCSHLTYHSQLGASTLLLDNSYLGPWLMKSPLSRGYSAGSTLSISWITSVLPNLTASSSAVMKPESFALITSNLQGYMLANMHLARNNAFHQEVLYSLGLNLGCKVLFQSLYASLGFQLNKSNE